MARGGFGVGNYLSWAGVPAAVLPMTLMGWFKVADVVGEKCIIRLGTGSGNDYGIALEVQDAGVQAIVGMFGFSYEWSTKTGVSVGTWMHAAGVFKSSTSRTVYLNGVAGTPNTVDRNWLGGTPDLTSVGAYKTFNNFNGDLAEIVVIQAALTAPEILAYYNGTISLKDLRTGAIRGYWSLDTGVSSEPNRCGYQTATLLETGTVTQTTHPTVPIYTPDGTLRVLIDNQRVFTKDGATGLILAGAHTWPGVIQFGSVAFPTVGTQDYRAYLDVIKGYGHNYTQLWPWDISRASIDPFKYVYPLPYARSATAGADDGGNKWDLDTFNQTDYFDRLRDYIQYAASLGIYVEVTLFENSLTRSDATWGDDGHPYKSTNNINSISGDTNADGSMAETYNLSISAVTTKQYAYVDKVLATIADLSNVIIGLVNEPYTGTTSIVTGATSGCDGWIAALHDHIIAYELASSTYQHLIHRGPTSGETNDQAAVVVGPGDTHAPNASWAGFAAFATPTIDPGPPLIYDTDHTGSSATADVFWRAALMGHGGLLSMEDHFLGGALIGSPSATVRANLGYIRTYVGRLHLATAVPSGSLSSTGYCLATAGTEYLVFQPGSAAFTVDLSSAPRVPFTARWLNMNDGAESIALVTGGSAAQTMTPPFGGSPSGIVLLLTVARRFLLKR